MSEGGQGLWRQVFRLSLGAFPRAVRAELGEDMERAFIDRLRTARVRGRAAGHAAALLCVVDALVQGAAERLSQVMSPVPGARSGRSPRGWSMQWSEWIQAVRALRRAPTFALVCVATFALVIGAATAIFGAVDAVLLRPLPYPDSESLVFVGELGDDRDEPATVASYYVLDQVRTNSSTLEDLAIFNIWEATLTEAGEPTRLSGAVAEWNYFQALRRPPALGRTFVEGEGARGGPRVVVISDRLWRDRLGSDPAIIGRSITLSGLPYEVIGVMPADFVAPDDFIFGARRPDVWRPWIAEEQATAMGAALRPDFRWLRAVARVTDGASLDQVNAELELVRLRIGETFAEWAEENRALALPLQEQVTASVRPVLALLGAMALLVLLVGGANLANLLLARGLGRTREVEMRAALGAGAVGAIRPLVLELILLAIAGGAVGILLAQLVVGALVTAAPADLPRLDAVRIDGRVVAAAFAVSLLIGALASLVPALRLAPVAGGIASIARSSRGASGSRRHHRAQSAFAIVQLGLALAVLTGATLLARSFARLSAVDPGFDAEGVIAAQIDLPSSRYATAAERVTFVDGVINALNESPAVSVTGFVTSLPQHGLNNFSMRMEVPGRTDGDAQPWAHYRGITRAYLETMGIALRRGRTLVPQDRVDGRARAALVNEEFARRFFADEEVLGARVVVNSDTVPIVGVVADVKYGWLGEEAQPELYVPYLDASTVFLSVKAAGDPAQAAAAMRAAVRAADPLLPIDELLSAERLLAASIAEPRFALFLLGALAAIALALSAVGLYGVISYAVSERTREIGIRVALGAREVQVTGLVLRRGLLIAALGVLLGLVLALNGSRLIENLLFGVDAYDPVTFALGTLLLTGIALLATWIPARRAARVDPIVALRNE